MTKNSGVGASSRIKRGRTSDGASTTKKKRRDVVQDDNEDAKSPFMSSIPRKRKEKEEKESASSPLKEKKKDSDSDDKSTPLFDSSSSDEDNDQDDKVEAPWRSIKARENESKKDESSDEDNDSSSSLVAMYDIKGSKNTKKKVRVKVVYSSDEDKKKSGSDNGVSDDSRAEKLTEVEMKPFVSQRNAEGSRRAILNDDEELFDPSSDSSDDEKDAPWREKTPVVYKPSKPKEESSQKEKKSDALPKVFMKKPDTNITLTKKPVTINKTIPKGEPVEKSIPKKSSMQSVPKKSLIPRKDPSSTNTTSSGTKDSSETKSLIDHAMKPMSAVKSSLYPSQNFKKDDKQQEETKVKDKLDNTVLREQRRPQQQQQQQPPIPAIRQQQSSQFRDEAYHHSSRSSQIDAQQRQQQQQTSMNKFDSRLENIIQKMKEDLDKKSKNEDDIFSLSTKQQKSTAVDFNGSFLISDDDNDDDKYDFYDRDNEGNIILQPKIPIFPEDFTGDQKSWPLHWWGIVEPPKEFLDEINQIDSFTAKNKVNDERQQPTANDNVKESQGVEQSSQQHRSHSNDPTRSSNRDYPDYKHQQHHPQAWRNGPNPASSSSRRDYGMYNPNRNPPHGRHEPPPFSSRHRDRRSY